MEIVRSRLLVGVTYGKGQRVHLPRISHSCQTIRWKYQRMAEVISHLMTIDSLYLDSARLFGYCKPCLTVSYTCYVGINRTLCQICGEI